MTRRLINVSCIIVLVILIFFVFEINRRTIPQVIKETKKADISRDITYECMKWGNGKGQVLIIFIDNESGIEKIELPNGHIIIANNKSKVAIDYTMDINTQYIFKMYNKEGELYEKTISIEMNIVISKKDEGYGYKRIGINYLSNVEETYEMYYKIGENGEWKPYKEEFYIWDYDLNYENWINADETITIYGKVKKQTGEEMEESVKIGIDTKIKEKVSEIEAESLIKAVSSEDFSIGMFNIKVKDEVYNVHAYEFDKSQTFDINTIFGLEDDVATSTSYAKRMVILKVNGDLIIEENKLLTAYASRNGYGGPKGMLLYVTGDIINNGNISMTARGAYAEGENVFLCVNENGEIEYIPAQGANGGNRVSSSSSYKVGVQGNNGQKGTDRRTGGGASGGAIYSAVSGAGGAGTSYSGGSGGGGALNSTTAQNAYPNGGKGGNANGKAFYDWNCGGGAGNPGGSGINGGQAGTRGTGGLLIIYSNNLTNNGTITSNGSKGGNGYRAGGGGSGGGSINIFYRNEYINSGSITANGGERGYGTRANSERVHGGTGGVGSVTIGSIIDGIFTKTYSN